MLRNSRFYSLSRQALTHCGPLRAPCQHGVISSLSKLATATERRTFTNSLPEHVTFRSQLTRTWRKTSFQSNRQTRLKSQHTGPEPSSGQEQGSQKPQSLSDRMKAMSRKYGWSVVGIYFGLSVLDFPFCFLAVRLFGVDRIGQIERAIVDGFWDLVERIAPSLRPEKSHAALDKGTYSGAVDGAMGENGVVAVHDNASIWTQLILAYGVHKSLIFLRIPLTLAVTPRIVKLLRSWGWKIGTKSA